MAADPDPSNEMPPGTVVRGHETGPADPPDVSDLLAAFGDLVLVFDHEGRLTRGGDDLSRCEFAVDGANAELSFAEVAFQLAARAAPIDQQTSPDTLLHNLLTWDTFQCELRQSAVEATDADQTWLLRKTAQPSGIVLHVSCITALTRQRAHERRSRQEAEDAAQAKSAFLASMSHELRTPLNGIIGFAELLTVGGRPDRVPEYAGAILESARHLLSVVNDILDLAKLEAGKTEPGREPVDAAEALQSALTMMQPDFDARRQTCAYQLDGRTIQWTGNKQHFVQIALNLISNASRYSPEGGAIEVDLDVDGEDLRLRVADQGPGMSPDQIKRARKPFAQLRSPYTRVSGGTGLGLPITEALLGLYGGRLEINARRDTGEGTEVNVALPLTGSA